MLGAVIVVGAGAAAAGAAGAGAAAAGGAAAGVGDVEAGGFLAQAAVRASRIVTAEVERMRLMLQL
jgi:hypothetical protein